MEPLFAKMALPSFGGAGSVWTTAILFFQTALLAGYLIAHGIQRLPLRVQAGVAGAALLAGLLVLPLRARVVPTHAGPLADLLLCLTIDVGAPFVALCMLGPLLQAWFSRIAGAGDPYFLYAASNAGSILGLLAFPLILEPFAGLSVIALGWAFAYAALGAAVIACAATAIRGHAEVVHDALAVASPWRTRLWWTALAFVPSSLMLGVTTYLGALVPPVPLLWVLPLAIYLLCFVIAFSRKPVVRLPLAINAVPYALLPILLSLVLHATVGLVLTLALHLAGLLVLCLALDLMLAEARPEPSNLTEFYAFLALGGALGGVFNAVIAPPLFPTVGEYPLVIVAALLLIALGPARRVTWTPLIAIVPLAFGAAALAFAHAVPESVQRSSARVFFAILTVALFPLWRRVPLAAALSAAVLLAATAGIGFLGMDVLDAKRDFYGVKMVIDDTDRGVRELAHGVTVHGVQRLGPAYERTPLSYYSRRGPVGDVFAAMSGSLAGARIGVVGLGIGSVACYARPGQHWQFYEIDPQIVAIAQDRALFTILTTCLPDAAIETGDARLSLGRVSSGSLRLLVLDAFDSDQPPVHLMTREAFALYERVLESGGVALVHLSSRLFDFRGTIAAVARDQGLIAYLRNDESPAEPGASASEWAVVARPGEIPPAILADPRWKQLTASPGTPAWTDDFSSLMRVRRWAQ